MFRKVIFLLIFSFGLSTTQNVLPLNDSFEPALIACAYVMGPVLLLRGLSNIIDSLILNENGQKKQEAQADLKSIAVAMNALNEQSSKEEIEHLNKMILDFQVNHKEVINDPAYAAFNRSWHLIATSYGILQDAKKAEDVSSNDAQADGVQALLSQAEHSANVAIIKPYQSNLLERLARLREDKDIFHNANTNALKEIQAQEKNALKWGVAQLVLMGGAVYYLRDK